MANSLTLFEDKSLNVIQNSHILTEEDNKVLVNLKDELNKTFLTAQMFRTRTEMEISILNDVDFPTPDAKYWQCVREQNVMFGELLRGSFEYKRNEIEMQKLEKEIAKMQSQKADELDVELKQIDLEEKTFKRINMEREAKDRIRELQEWHIIMDKIKPDMKFSDEDVNQHQLISYTRRFLQWFLAGGPNQDADSARNLTAQLTKALKVCQEKEIIEKVIEPFLGIPKIAPILEQIVGPYMNKSKLITPNDNTIKFINNHK